MAAQNRYVIRTSVQIAMWYNIWKRGGFSQVERSLLLSKFELPQLDIPEDASCSLMHEAIIESDAIPYDR
jgi:hypothetical protein